MGHKRELSLRVSKRTRSNSSQVRLLCCISPYGGKESPAGYKALRHLAWRGVELRRASRKVQDQGGHDRLKKLRTHRSSYPNTKFASTTSRQCRSRSNRSIYVATISSSAANQALPKGSYRLLARQVSSR